MTCLSFAHKTSLPEASTMKSDAVRINWDKQYKKYYRESDPFNQHNKARIGEWDAIYDAFAIDPIHFPKLVDFGCGNGHFALNFHKKGYAVTGIDVSSEALRIVRQRMRIYKVSGKLRLIQSDLYKRRSDLEGRFDAGCMIATYQFISDKKEEQKKVLTNFTRLIRKNGKILIMEANPFNPLFYFYYAFVSKTNSKQGLHTANSRKSILMRFLKEAEMKDIKVFYHSFFPTSYINRWTFIKNINRFLCSIPGIRNFSAFHIITAVKIH